MDPQPVTLRPTANTRSQRTQMELSALPCCDVQGSLGRCVKYSGKVQGDQKVSVHLMITIQKSGAQRIFDHPVVTVKLFTLCKFYTLKCL